MEMVAPAIRFLAPRLEPPLQSNLRNLCNLRILLLRLNLRSSAVRFLFLCVLCVFVVNRFCFAVALGGKCATLQVKPVRF
jgi:hypothetical protein